MATPKSKSEILTLIDTYIPTTAAPNIRAVEHREIETAILDRVDGRIIQTGTFNKLNWNGWANHIIFFPSNKPAYTNNYVVMVTPANSPSHRASYTITGRTTTQFSIILQGNSGTYSSRFWYAVFSKQPL